MNVVLHFSVPETPGAVIISVGDKVATELQLLVLAEVLRDPEVKAMLAAKATAIVAPTGPAAK